MATDTAPKKTSMADAALGAIAAGHNATRFHVDGGRPVASEEARRLGKLPDGGAPPYVYAASVGLDKAGYRYENKPAPQVMASADTAAPKSGPQGQGTKDAVSKWDNVSGVQTTLRMDRA